MDAILRELSTLLQRLRLAHPTAGLWEAADLQWWSRHPRPLPPRIFPDAAVVFTSWATSTGLAVIGADPGLWPAIDAGLARLMGPVQTEVSTDDGVTRDGLAARGFALDGDTFMTLWRSAAPVTGLQLPAGYAMVSRDRRPDGPHWMTGRNGAKIEATLAATSIYRADCDLAVLAPDGTVAGYALFWPDLRTGVGLIEPMRVEDAHAGRRIGSALMAEGLRRLIGAGCTRLKVTFEVGNTAAERLYVGAGFEPSTPTVSMTRP